MSDAKPPAPSPASDVAPVEQPKSAARIIADRVKEQFGEAIEEIRERLGEVSVTVKRERIVEVCRFLKSDAKSRFNLLSDLTGFDHGIDAEPRFEVVYQLSSLPNKLRLRLRVKVSEEDCHVPTVSTVWQTANWHERETFDLFGIRFEGHPDLRKILTPDDLEGHPLRKDFPLRGY